jgi:hypothetical protein
MFAGNVMFAKSRASLVALALAAGLAAPAFAQAAPEPAAGSYTAPRTLGNKPDFQGIWTNASVTRMERPAGLPLELTREQADKLEGGALYNQRIKTEASYVDPKQGAPEAGKALPPVGNYDVAWTDPGSTVANINGSLRSSFIVFPENGRIPAMTEEGKKLRASKPRRLGTGYDHPEERGLSERCVFLGTAGPPFGNYLYNNNFQIVQTPEDLVIMSEMVHDVRIARIGQEHRKDDVEQWMGDSIARWDGDTLVVETTHINPTQRHSSILLSKTGKVIERFTRISDNQILYAFEINDPATYTQVWKAEMPLTRMKTPLFEYACHEGNYGLENILKGGRLDDARGVVHTGGQDRGE